MTDLKNLSESELAEKLAVSLAHLVDSRQESELLQLTHELQTHQIELEMQNRELREAQLELEESRNRYADLYDFAPVAYLGLDARGIIHEINLTGAILLGQERARIIGTPFTNFLEQGEKIKFFQHLEQVFQSSGNVINELQLQPRGKGAVPISIQIESRSSNSTAAEDGLCRAIVTDISERRRWVDALLKSKAEAEAASQAKSKFLARMSHELRTPLNAILGFAQIMKISRDDVLIAEHRDNIETIIHSGWHLLRIINDVLNLASIEAHKIDLEIDNVSVEERIQRCTAIILPLALQNNIALSCTEATCNNLTVHADSFRLKQILLNLMANAVKYNRDGGSVTLHCRVTPLGRVRIAVSDTGPGIRKEDIPSLFESFSRLPERSFAVQGAGIGLSIAKELTELMDGTIGIESVYGQGSTFWIELPQGESTAPAVPAEPTPGNANHQTALSEITILYVEDNPRDIKLLEVMFENMPGIKLLSTHSPTLGLELALAHQPDIIVLDINLPGMNGYQLLEHFLANEVTRETPVIAVSAGAMPDEIEKGLRAGFRHYFTKPLNVTEFRKSVSETLCDNAGSWLE